ncbi:MAG: hypothetical protein U5L04_01825, partial [Trueperaceae bacterium]|nr:hypothetical protein [Trueperaceae bacterium]
QTSAHAKDPKNDDIPKWAADIDLNDLPDDRPRMDPMQFSAAYGERTDCRGLLQDTDKVGRIGWYCEHIDARMLKTAIEGTVHAPRATRWDLIDIWIEVLMRDPDNDRLMRPDEFREQYRGATGKRFSLHQADRLRWVITNHEAWLVAKALGRTHSADHPGWRYFSSTLNGMREARDE